MRGEEELEDAISTDARAARARAGDDDAAAAAAGATDMQRV